MRECNEGIVTLEYVDGSTFRHIVDYIYKGNLDGVDDLECIADIYMAADMFQMTDLLEEVLRLNIAEVKIILDAIICK